MAKKKQEDASELAERCPRCQSVKFAIDKSTGVKRYCDKCKHVWTAQNKFEIENSYLKEEVAELKAKLEEVTIEKNKLADIIAGLENSEGVMEADEGIFN